MTDDLDLTHPEPKTGGPPPHVETRRTSLPAVGATVALVLFSIFIGTYGPRLGNRQQLPAGITLVELADAIEPRHAQRAFDARQLGRDSASRFLRGESSAEADLEQAELREQFSREASEMVGNRVELPRLANARVRWIEVDRVRLPGASGAMLFCAISPKRGQAAAESFASILVLEDEDRFTVFDRYSRPQPMPEGEVFSVMVRESTDGAMAPAAVLMLRIGRLMYAVQADGVDLAQTIVAELEQLSAQTEGNANPSTVAPSSTAS